MKAIQKLNLRFLNRIVDQWTNCTESVYYNCTHFTLEYQDLTNHSSSNESVLNGTFHFTPCISGLEGAVEEITEQIAKEGSTKECKTEAHKSNLGFEDNNFSADVTSNAVQNFSTSGKANISGMKISCKVR